ncbi:MAG: hypothetical protein JO272_03885 [Pseudonocardiales bacterium]|nr:hypothetical protein [Pseudonocardiales bacterium]
MNSAGEHLTRAELAARTTQGKPTTPPQVTDTGPVLMVRYRAGVIGETQRTIHAVRLLPANTSAEGTLTALCDTILNPADLDIVDFRDGMPCMTCLFHLATITHTPDPGTPG